MVSVAIMLVLGTLLKFINQDQAIGLIKPIIALVIFTAYLSLVFISSLQMQVNDLNNKLEQYQKQFHNDIMKKYIEIEEKCGRKLK